MKFNILNVCINHSDNEILKVLKKKKAAEWAGNVKQNEKGILLLYHNICGLFFSFAKSSIFLSDRICKLECEWSQIFHLSYPKCLWYFFTRDKVIFLDGVRDPFYNNNNECVSCIFGTGY